MSTTPAAPLVMMFRINETLIARAMDGLTEDQLWQRPTNQNNPALWLVGHVVRSRARLLTAIGDPFDIGWGEAFARGSTVEERATYVPRAEIEAMMGTVNQRLYPKMESLSAEDLAQPATGPVPLIKTLADLATFLTMHESYHVGQLGYIRKALGLSGLVG